VLEVKARIHYNKDKSNVSGN